MRLPRIPLAFLRRYTSGSRGTIRDTWCASPANCRRQPGTSCFASLNPSISPSWAASITARARRPIGTHSPLGRRPRKHFACAIRPPILARRRSASGRRRARAGRVGVIIVAGGEGSRLGFPHPKGMFPIGPISGHSLFQILLEKVQAVARRFSTRLPVYLMTSPSTHDETSDYLNQHDWFGLDAADRFVFRQGTMPAVDAATGKILLSAPDEIALSPDGHGGMLAALANSGGLDDLARRGIERLFYCQVDNPLVALCDPEFLGDHILTGSRISTQVVAKRDATERVGVVVSLDGRTRIIEYSDLPADVAGRTG